MTSVEDCKIIKVMNAAGYIENTKIADTLQGTVWRSLQKSTNKSVVIKTTQRSLHKQSAAIVRGKKIKVQENIKKEMTILKKLSRDSQCPGSIIKYMDSFQSAGYYFMVMEDGGYGLFDFVVKAHRFMKKGVLTVKEWHKTCKIILKQMMECIEYIHHQNICHFDISLENFLINHDVKITVNRDGKIRFCADSIQIKLCDFGLAEMFPNEHFASNKYCGKINYKSPELTSFQRTFCAKSNDMWCLGVCLFIMIIGSAPWQKACKYDARFIQIMNGDIVKLLSRWNVLHYTNRSIVDLFTSFFQFEEKRVSMEVLKGCEWFEKSIKINHITPNTFE